MIERGSEQKEIRSGSAYLYAIHVTHDEGRFCYMRIVVGSEALLRDGSYAQLCGGGAGGVGVDADGSRAGLKERGGGRGAGLREKGEGCLHQCEASKLRRMSS